MGMTISEKILAAHAGKERAAGFLAEHIAVRLAPLAHRPFDDRGEPARDRTEELVAGIDEFSRQVGAGVVLEARGVTEVQPRAHASAGLRPPG